MSKPDAYRLGWRSLKHVCPDLTDSTSQGLAVELATAMVRLQPSAGWDQKSAADFVAQCAHESGSFQYIREIWGPTPVQAGYWSRRDIQGPGPLYPGLGYLTRGAGWIQTTGRSNFRRAAGKLGVRYTSLLVLANRRSYASLLAAAWWQDAFPRGTDGLTVAEVTRVVNGGENGLAEREVFTARALSVAEYLVPKRRKP